MATAQKEWIDNQTIRIPGSARAHTIHHIVNAALIDLHIRTFLDYALEKLDEVLVSPATTQACTGNQKITARKRARLEIRETVGVSRHYRYLAARADIEEAGTRFFRTAAQDAGLVITDSGTHDRAWVEAQVFRLRSGDLADRIGGCA